MKNAINPQPINALGLAKLLAEHGYRLFSVLDIKALLKLENREVVNLKQALYFLSARGWIHALRRDLYALDDVFLESQPIHEYEFATRIVSPSAISHFTAFHVHELTDQLPLIIYVTIPTGVSYPRGNGGELFSRAGVRYRFVQVKKDHFFGIDHIWRGSAKIPITDLEKTLLDGLAKPQYCGGMREVIHAFTVRSFDIEKIVDYVLRLDVSIAKRLGWVLEKTGHQGAALKILAAIPRKGYIKLDPTADKLGKYNNRWHIVENL